MNKKLIFGIASFIVLYVLISFLSNFYADYQWFSNKAKTGVNQFNLAVGYLF